MRHFNKYITVLLASLFVIGCAEEDPMVEIDSISAMGDEFFFQQKVKVWAAVKSDNLPAARYTWSCDGGRLTQPQSLDENTWQAPSEPGVYRITCTVEVDGVKKTRSRDMFVSTFYFDKLERTPHTLGPNNSSATLVLDQATNTSHLEARVSTTSATRGYMQRSFADPLLHAPFSTQARVGWISDFPAKDIKIGTAVAENTLYYEWTLSRDPDAKDNLFIDNLRFEWYPVSKSSGLPVANGQPWNGTLRYQQRNLATNATTVFNVYVNHPALNFAKNQYKKVSLSIDADYIVHVFVEGVEVLNTDSIKVWRQTNASQDDIHINQWRINYVSNTGKTPLIYIDDLVGSNDGTVLK
jgi:hypothetical protein